MTASLALSPDRGPGPKLGVLLGCLLFAVVTAVTTIATAQNRPVSTAEKRSDGVLPVPETPALGVVEWLKRMNTASRDHNYVGTFVVSAAVGNLSSARIWHACQDKDRIERIEALSGPPRSTFRRNDQVLTFLPDEHVIKSENRDNLELFPNLMGVPDSTIGNFYGVRVMGRDRVAGFEADVVQLIPKDALRFGYRIWSEQRTGLVMKLQTLDASGRPVEQSAFSELQLDAPIKIESLAQMMKVPAGYKVQKSELERTTAAAQGWTLKNTVPGFKPISCYRRPVGSAGNERALQWTFSDGLAAVSLFVEAYDEQRPNREGVQALGATYTLTRRLVGRDGVNWWLTVMGEVPAQTLDAFAQQLVRIR